MRELKFRAYIKSKEYDFIFNEIGKIVGVNSINFETKRIMVNCGSSFMSISLKDVELMRFTGLYDKNGKEIYEGDILKGTFYDIPEPKYDYVFNVLWNENCEGFLAEHFEPKECEVIGNIYENKDLL